MSGSRGGPSSSLGANIRVALRDVPALGGTELVGAIPEEVEGRKSSATRRGLEGGGGCVLPRKSSCVYRFGATVG